LAAQGQKLTRTRLKGKRDTLKLEMIKFTTRTRPMFNHKHIQANRITPESTKMEPAKI